MLPHKSNGEAPFPMDSGIAGLAWDGRKAHFRVWPDRCRFNEGYAKGTHPKGDRRVMARKGIYKGIYYDEPQTTTALRTIGSVENKTAPRPFIRTQLIENTC